jgi:hypothetical protein
MLKAGGCTTGSYEKLPGSTEVFVADNSDEESPAPKIGFQPTACG